MSDRIDHEALRESAALYALGALTLADRRAFAGHLATCADCSADVLSFRSAVSALAAVVPQIDPPAALRARVLSVAGGRHARVVAMPPPRTVSRLPWLAAAASLVAVVGLGMYSVQLRGRMDSLSAQLRQARVQLENSERELVSTRRMASDAQATVMVISAPDLRRSDLAGQVAVAPQASARAFWSRTRGLIFSASDLPPLPAGRTYQLWIVPASGAPVSAGLFEPDANGRIQAVVTTPVDAAQAAAMALTIEPAGGVPAPTGARYLVGTVSGG